LAASAGLSTNEPSMTAVALIAVALTAVAAGTCDDAGVALTVGERATAGVAVAAQDEALGAGVDDRATLVVAADLEAAALEAVAEADPMLLPVPPCGNAELVALPAALAEPLLDALAGRMTAALGTAVDALLGLLVSVELAVGMLL
jgi:hypothetical protein